MASILRVNTLTDASSNNSVAMATVASGSVKAFSTVDTSSSNSVLSSLNIASISDVGTGVITSNFTSAFSNGDYYELAIADASLGDYSLGNTVDTYSSTTSARTYNVRRDNGSAVDEPKAGILILGALA